MTDPTNITSIRDRLEPLRRQAADRLRRLRSAIRRELAIEGISWLAGAIVARANASHSTTTASLFCSMKSLSRMS